MPDIENKKTNRLNEIRGLDEDKSDKSYKFSIDFSSFVKRIIIKKRPNNKKT